MDNSLAIIGKATMTADPIKGVRNALRVVARRTMENLLLVVMQSH
jgi:hypothetical protein